MIRFNSSDYYNPMIVVSNSYYGAETWELFTPLRSYGVATNMRLCRWGSVNCETHSSLASALKRALRAKAMVKAFKHLDVYCIAGYESEGNRKLPVYQLVETDADAVALILQSGSK